jgi:glutaredoxin-like YruB-family protein
MKKVVIYSTPTCPFCIRVKQFMRENDIAFEDIDVSANPEKAQEMIKISGQMGVPVISVDGEIVVGFDKERIKELLGF